MANVPKNLNNWSPSQPTGERNTKPVDGMAHEGKDWNSKNETKEYVSRKVPMGKPGGENSGGD